MKVSGGRGLVAGGAEAWRNLRGEGVPVCLLLAILGLASIGSLKAESLAKVEGVPAQPLRVQVERLVQALDYVGRPLAGEEVAALFRADADREAFGDRVQTVLDPHCLAAVTISPESRVSVEGGPAVPAVVEGDWSLFLIKVYNEAGVTAPLRVTSSEEAIGAVLFADRPLNPRLSGLIVEYRVLLVKAEAAGPLASVMQFDVGQGSQDLGFRSDLPITFTAEKRHVVTLDLRDADSGEAVTCALEIRNEKGFTFPSQPMRVAPDFRFHPQVYRESGETVSMPPGRYRVRATRGPEYLPVEKDLVVSGEGETGFRVELKRWIDPAAFGWWSGDHHIHAAGCKHYVEPTEGVHAPDMFRHCRGEDLKIGANLTWGPCFDYQKQFFTGDIDKVSKYPYLLRYDVEVSGFGSHRSGHLCLLRLKRQIYPGGASKDHWPTLCLNTLKWAQKQGAVCGPAHSGWGLAVASDELPNYEIPPFDGIGANEYIVDVTHEVEGPDGDLVPAVDFLSMVDTPSVWELNIWYHTLNCGYRTRISGETDFPCIYGERVGLGRSYIKLDGRLDYDDWCEGISLGRGYVSDGRSHLIDFAVDGLEVGTEGSERRLDRPGPVTVTAKVAGRLEVEPERLANVPRTRFADRPEIMNQPYAQKPYWHIERARVPGTRQVQVELLVNGEPVRTQAIEADGRMVDLAFEDVQIERSAWLALRILPSSHTNPVFVLGCLCALTTSLLHAEDGKGPDPDKPLHVFLLVGQSNMAGRATIEAPDKEPIAETWLWHIGDKRWEPAVPPYNLHSPHRKEVAMQRLNGGPSFVRSYREANPGVQVGIVCSVRGGTSIEEWEKGRQKPWPLYDTAVAATREALKGGGQLVGILWHQGESNAGRSELYPDQLVALVANFRKDLAEGAPVPFVFGQIGPWREEYRAFNEMIVTVSERIPRSACVRSDGLTNMDKAHFDTASQRELGKRYAAALLTLRKDP